MLVCSESAAMIADEQTSIAGVCDSFDRDE
jgi:hypothetical protein